MGESIQTLAIDTLAVAVPRFVYAVATCKVEVDA